MKHRHTISRGDLLRCVLRFPDAEEAVAALCGYAPSSPAATEDLRFEARVEPVVLQATGPVVRATFQTSPVKTTSCRFLMPLRFRPYEGEADDPGAGPNWLEEEPITKDELSAAPTPPAPAPLVPWSRLWPFLHRALGCCRPGRRPDIRRLVERLALLRPLRRVPRIEVLTWASQAWVLVDDRPELAPFHADFANLVKRLQRQRGRGELVCGRLDRPGSIQASAEIPVLVLSDLGRLQRDAELTEQWRQFGADLNRRGVRATALLPCPTSRWDRGLARDWHCACWDRSRHLRYPPARPLPRPPHTPEDEAARAETLLDLLAPALRIEPALLRGARLLLSSQQADVGTEFDVWHHQEAARTRDAMAVRPAVALRRRTAFAQLDNELKKAVAQLIRDAHRHWSVTFFARETLNLHECGTPLPPTDLDRALRILRRINRTMFDIVRGDRGRAQILRLFEWQHGDFARSSSVARAMPESAASWALARTLRGEQACAVPDGIDTDEVERTQNVLLAGDGRPLVWQIRRVGSELVLGPWPVERSSGSPLALLPAVAPRFDLALVNRDGDGSLLNLLPRDDPELRVPVHGARTVAIRSDRGELELAALEPPEWATRFGWDRFGMFADFEVGGVTFPLRWIPPGEFVMGSPEDEAGRWDDEGPQHRVTVGRGFWLGAMPVTQGQYAAVTGDRPSEFRNAGDQAPVEQVSWEDCQKFCQDLPEKVTDLDAELEFRLPAEAEWEYACRAGATTALYTGPLTIEGENNGPELNPIAWYGGNSGVDYEGGRDSSDWPNRQYEHTRAGTHPVGEKQPNAWGLYDMLGNVWEWCQDEWHDNYEGAPNDGSAWGSEGLYGRYCVYRGGGWACYARDCRCAYRHYWEPDIRDDYLGFRLVLAARVNGGIRPFS